MDSHQADLQLDIAVKVGKTETMVADMHARLFGNGQPGLLDKLDEKIELLDDRVVDLEHSKNKVLGGVTVIGALASWAGWAHVREFFTIKPHP